MSRSILAGAAAIVLLFAGSVGVLSWATRVEPAGRDASPGPALRDVPRASEPAAAMAPAPAPAPAAPPVTVASTATVPPISVAPVPPPRSKTARSSAATAVEQRLPIERRQALASFRRELMAGLAALEPRVAGCSSRGAAAYLLDVEAIAGGVRILDAHASSDGETATDAACARAALAGQVIPAQSAVPGRRWQLPFSPRSS